MFQMSYRLTPEEIAERKAQKKSTAEWQNEMVLNIIRSSYCVSKMSKVSDSILNDIIPPKATETILDIDEWFNRFVSMVKIPKPFIELDCIGCL